MTTLRHALRLFAKNPAFSVVAVLTLATGIGANTAIFSIVNGVLLRPLPYPDPERIVQLWEKTDGSPRVAVSNPNFLDWRQRATGFEAMAAYSGGTGTVLGGPEAVFADVYTVSDGFFRVFGVIPTMGRTFTAEEMRVGGVPAVVVSRRFWERTLGSEPDLTRLRVAIEGVSARVVGVMPEAFAYPAGAEIWFPKELFHDDSGRTGHNYSVVAKLRPGVSAARASAEMNAIAAALKQEHGTDENATAVTILELREALTGGSRTALLMLLGAVALVLLVACANVATTMMARGEERRTELAVRAALGASRGRLVRQLLVESGVLAVVAAALGLLLGGWMLRALLSITVALPRQESVGIDARVLALTIALAVLTPLLFGFLPSLHAARPDLREVLAEGSRTAIARTRRRVRALLVTVEVAVALLLLVGAALLIRSFANVMWVDPGFDTRAAVTATMAVPGSKYADPERAARFYERLLERLRAVPGVTAAGAVNQVPLSGFDFGGGFTFEGRAAAFAADRLYAGYRVATPGYLEALGVPLVRGRLLDDSDRPGREPVAVVNQRFVQQYLRGVDPLGVRFKYRGMDPQNPVFTIVGVVRDVHHRSLVREASPEVYVSVFQQPYRARGGMTAVVRGSTDAAGAFGAAVRDTIRQADPDVPVQLATLERLLVNSVADRRFLLVVLAAFAAVALLLAGTGIYGVLSRSVVQRTQEIGIRMALGADPRTVVRLMLGSALAPVAGGLVAGGLAASVGVRLLESFLFGVAPSDPLAIAGAAILLLLVAVIAAWIPARRATRVDPLIALRAQ